MFVVTFLAISAMAAAVFIDSVWPATVLVILAFFSLIVQWLWHRRARR